MLGGLTSFSFRLDQERGDLRSHLAFFPRTTDLRALNAPDCHLYTYHRVLVINPAAHPPQVDRHSSITTPTQWASERRPMNMMINMELVPSRRTMSNLASAKVCVTTTAAAAPGWAQKTFIIICLACACAWACAAFNTPGSGGGGAAGKSRNSTSLNYERHVPKFLQPYAHLLGQQKQQNEDEPQIVAAQQRLQEQEDDDDDDKAAEQVWAVLQLCHREDCAAHNRRC